MWPFALRHVITFHDASFREDSTQCPHSYTPARTHHTPYLTLQFVVFWPTLSTKTSRTETKYLNGALDHRRESILGIPHATPEKYPPFITLSQHIFSTILHHVWWMFRVNDRRYWHYPSYILTSYYTPWHDGFIMSVSLKPYTTLIWSGSSDITHDMGTRILKMLLVKSWSKGPVWH